VTGHGVLGAPPLLVIAGATATGKTDLAIRLGRALLDDGVPAAVISADSRQVYRGLDIGTAKASLDERLGVPHHGLDLVDPDAPFSVADFADHAHTALEALRTSGGVGILAGGTGLYLRAVARGLDTTALPHDPDVRTALEAALATGGLSALADRLRAIAPRRSETVDLRNPRRVVRALEIATVLGDVPPPAPRGYAGPIDWLGLVVPPAIHRDWIARRARAQFAAGLMDEADALRRRWDPALRCFSAIGYREAWAVLDGTLDREAGIELDAHRNVAFARRQATWFRAEPGITWLDPTTADPLPSALAAARGLLAARA
jgi:tRNA dimethylallyltransferase